jgi:long-chain acyl-CoA synthetase
VETLTDLLELAAARYGQRVALTLRAGLRDETWSYRRLLQGAQSIAQALRQDHGVRPGDRVLVCASNSPRLVAAYFGCWFAGAAIVPLDSNSTADFVACIAATTRPAVALVGSSQGPALGNLPAIRLVDLPLEGGPAPGARPDAADLAEIVFTSGTTGDPKGVLLTHANVVANVRALEDVIPRRPGYRLLSLLPLSHMLEQTAGLYLPLLYGASIHFLPTRQPSAVFKALRRQRITGMVVTPLLLEALWRAVEQGVRTSGRGERWERSQRLAERLPLIGRRLLFAGVHRQIGGAFQFFLCGGAHLPVDQALAWERLGIRVVQGYGATECAPVVASQTWRSRPSDSVGRPLRGVEVRLTAEGELLVRGPNVTSGYWRNPVATAAAFDAERWYRTGDLAEIDERGAVRLKGRLRDLIVLANGLNVYPEDVESALRQFATVADCVVVGVLNSAGHPQVYACVRLMPDATGTAEPARLALAVGQANAGLASHQRITGSSVWPDHDFPRTAALKVKRQVVRAVIEGAARPLSVAGPRAPGRDRAAIVRAAVAAVAGVDPSRVRPETDLTVDLPLDSLARVELAARLEDELGVPVDDEQVANATTVGELLVHLTPDDGPPPQPPLPRWALALPARLCRIVAQRVAIFPVHRLLVRRLSVDAIERLGQAPSPCLFIANHSSHLDTPTVLRAMPPRLRRSVAVAAAADYFYQDARVGAVASLMLNTFPFARHGNIRSSLDYCGELLDAGWSVLLYPEGTRSADGTLQPFKNGIGLLATELRAPIIPLALSGCAAILPKGARRPCPGAVRIRVGEPVLIEAGMTPAAATARLEDAVRHLLTAP